VTGGIQDRRSLLRFVVGPDGEIVPDVAARLPGRGLWLTPRRDVIERAIAKRLFARAARRPVTVRPDLGDRVEALLVRRCCDSLGLARRAGLAVAGFEKVGEAVRAGKSALLLSAMDGAEAGIGKIGALGQGLPCAVVLSASEIGEAFGRDRVVHAAVGHGPLCDRVLIEAERIAGLRPGAALRRRTNGEPANNDGARE